MRVLHTEASTGWGGQEIRILKESIGLRSRGHEIFFAIAKGGKLVGEAKKNQFKVYELNFKRSGWLITFFQLLKIFKKENIELVNTHSSLDAWIGGISARFAKLPVMRTRHLSASVKEGLNSRIVYHHLADYVVTTCEKMTSILSKQSRKDKKYFQSIPTGINPQEMQVDPKKVQEFREKHHIHPKDILVGMVCFMRSWKGVEDFFKAAKLLCHVRDLKWIIIGAGHIDTYKLKAKELGVEDLLIFTGHISPPYHAIAALDIFLLLSTANEGVSQASLQAAFLKKPLITTCTGGLCEVCIPQLSGLQVPIFSPKEVAKAIVTLKDSPTLRERFGKNAHQLVIDKFCFDIMLDKMEEIYKQIDLHICH